MITYIHLSSLRRKETGYRKASGGSRTFPYLLALRGVCLCNYWAIFVSIGCVNDGSSFQDYTEPSQRKYDTIEIALPSDLLCRVVCSKNKPPFLFPIHVIHLIYPPEFVGGLIRLDCLHGFKRTLFCDLLIRTTPSLTF
jgi:hypothetical protein